jgi:hypothetical protein
VAIVLGDAVPILLSSAEITFGGISRMGALGG